MAQIKERARKNGKPGYFVRIRVKNHPVQTATFDRLTDARNWAQQIEAAMRDGRYSKTSESQKHSLSELLERYEKTVFPHKPKLAKEYKRNFNWWNSQIGHLKLSEITTADITECKDRLASEMTNRNTLRTPATVNRYLAALSSAMNVAVKEWQWIEDNPVMRVSKMKEPRGRTRFLSDKERTDLLEACRNSKNTQLYIAVVLALSTGARRMELWSLNWSDVDLERGMIILKETKNGEIRSIPLKGHALELMKEHSKVRRLDTQLIFPSKINPQVPLDFRAPFEKALEEAAVQDFRWHDLRHTCASYLAMQGASLTEIAAVLGHRSLNMVKRYSHVGDQHTASIVEQMNQKMFG